MTFYPHKYKKSLRRAIFHCGVVSLIILIYFNFTSVSAALLDTMQGFAWGGTESVDGAYKGLGWISTNNLSDGAVVDYGISVPAGGDGDITGYAWSEYYGWISFNGDDLAGCLPVLSQAKRVGNTITGGARIVAIKDEVSVGNAGGFDGCISFDKNGPDTNQPITFTETSTVPPTFTIDKNINPNTFGWSSDLGWIDFNGVEIFDRRPNLVQPLIRPLVFPDGYDEVTGYYNSVLISFQTGNNGMTDITALQGADYNIRLQIPAPAAPSLPYDENHVGSLGVVLAGTTNPDYSYSFSNVPYGFMGLDVCVDSSFVINEYNETDNCRNLNGPTVLIPPPTPDLSIWVNRTVIENNSNVIVSWDTDLTYPMNCKVDGPGISVPDFDPSQPTNPPGNPTGSVLVNSLTAKSVFTIECTEPITGAVFRDEATVEVVGTVEEI